MTVRSIDPERALALAKFLILALEEVLDLVSKPWEQPTPEQIAAGKPYGLHLVVDRLTLAKDAIAEVADLPNRKAATGFSREGARILLTPDVRALKTFVAEARTVPDLAAAAHRVFTCVGVTVTGLLAEAARPHGRSAEPGKEVTGRAPATFLN